MNALEGLIVETRLLFRELRAASERVHGESHSAARRSILFELVDDGPRSVPQLAEARHVTRQAIQALADALVGDGLVERAANPGHRRSPLYAATPRGAARASEMRARERGAFEALDLGLPVARLREAAETLRAVREALRRHEG